MYPTAADAIRAARSATRAELDFGRALTEAYRRGQATRAEGRPVPDAIQRDAEHGDPEADAFFTGWIDAGA